MFFFFGLYFTYFFSDLYYFLYSADFGTCLSFYNSFRWWVRLFIWDFSCFLRKVCITINFPLRTAFAVSIDFGVLCFQFHLSWGKFWFLLWFPHWPIGFSVACCLVSMSVLFPFFFLQLISCFITLWSEQNVWYNFCVLKFAETCFVAQRGTYPGECSMCTWKECSAAFIWNTVNVSSKSI